MVLVTIISTFFSSSTPVHASDLVVDGGTGYRYTGISPFTGHLTTHYLEEVEALSDRIGIMAKGKLTAIGTVAELTKQTGTSKLEDAFVILSGGTA